MYHKLRPRRTSVPVDARRIVDSLAMAGQSLEAKAKSKSRVGDHEVSCLPIGSNRRSQGEQANEITAIIFMKRIGRNARRMAS